MASGVQQSFICVGLGSSGRGLEIVTIDALVFLSAAHFVPRDDGRRSVRAKISRGMHCMPRGTYNEQ